MSALSAQADAPLAAAASAPPRSESPDRPLATPSPAGEQARDSSGPTLRRPPAVDPTPSGIGLLLRLTSIGSTQLVSATLMIVMLALGLLTAGCGLKKPPADKRQFVLDVSRTPAGRGLTPSDGILLNVRTVRVSPLYEGTGLVYRKKDGTFEQDFYNEFFSTPAYLLTEELRQWLTGAPFVRQILDGDSLDLATHVLATRVNALYGDFTASPPKAILEVEFGLQKRGGAPEILFHNVYAKAIAAESASPEALVRAWTQGLGEILGELERDLANSRR